MSTIRRSPRPVAPLSRGQLPPRASPLAYSPPLHRRRAAARQNGGERKRRRRAATTTPFYFASRRRTPSWSTREQRRGQPCEPSASAKMRARDKRAPISIVSPTAADDWRRCFDQFSTRRGGMRIFFQLRDAPMFLADILSANLRIVIARVL